MRYSYSNNYHQTSVKIGGKNITCVEQQYNLLQDYP
jgi:hypothetical protein